MTREEKQKAIDALKISAPVMAVTQEKFNDYIQTLNKIMNWLEQEPKTGHWIYTPIKRLVDDEEYKYITDYKCSCSKCGADFGFQKISDPYCKYCGSRMVEPQESEDD